MAYKIDTVSSREVLEKAFAFYQWMFEDKVDTDNPEYSLEKWAERMKHHGDLMLYACIGHEVIGIVFGRIRGDHSMTVGPVAVHPNHRGTGLAKKMMIMLEERAFARGIQVINLGAVESAEGFYTKLGYLGALLIQSEHHSVAQLLSLDHNYPVKFTNIYDKRVNQVCLEMTEPDIALRKAYEQTYPGCHTMMMYSKELQTTSLARSED